MRPVERIDEFTSVLNYIWKTRCPDWRFTQFIENVFGDLMDLQSYTFWKMEEDKSLETICGFLNTSLDKIRKEMAENGKK